jgi:hypothetical protein
MRINYPISFLMMLTGVACAAEVSIEDETEDAICGVDCDSRFYAHPLQQVKKLEDGRLPYFDARRSPSGKAYAIGEGRAESVEHEATSLFSGVVELDVRVMTEKERREKPERQRNKRPPSKLDVTLRELIESGTAPAHLLPIRIHLNGRPEGTVTQKINRAIAEGRVRTQREREAIRQEEMAAIAAELRPAIDAVASEIEFLGGRLIYPCTFAPCLTAQLSVDQLLVLAKRSDVQRIGMLEKSRPDGLTGSEKAEVYQTRIFWDETFVDQSVTYAYDGNNGQSTDIRVAVLDDEGFRTSHVAFREDSGGTRIDGLWDCRTPPCASVGSFVGIDAHGTAVLGTVLGDYRDGQDPAVNTAASQDSRSASGGEAKAYLYWADRSTGDQQAVYDNIVVRNPAPHLLVSSNSVGAATDCSGEDTKAIGADGVYESGIAYFKSANNFGGSAANCNVGPPGEAIGVFTVGGYTDPGNNVCDMREAPIDPASGWGGSTSDFDEGKFRSIIALTGAYSGSNVPWWSSDTAVANFSGTSHANPSVAAAAINFIDQMKNYQTTNFIDDPGVLYAWMLNMGDRRNQSGTQMTSRFDHRTGAGNIKMRFIGAPGLDAPYYWYHYEACISDGEIYTININDGNVLSADVDSLRAVAWWYDRRIENGTDIDDIDLRLKTVAGSTLRSSVDSYDNKERVFYNDVGGQAVKLEVSGFDVTSDSEGCGANSMRVFITVLVEDDDRDDADGPAYDAVTCEGVETL